MRYGKTQRPALWQDLRPQGPQSHSMPQIWCQPLDVPCSQSTRTAKEAKHESSEVICIFSYFFYTEFPEIGCVSVELPFVSSLVPSWSHRHWEEFEEATSLHQERWPQQAGHGPQRSFNDWKPSPIPWKSMDHLWSFMFIHCPQMPSAFLLCRSSSHSHLKTWGTGKSWCILPAQDLQRSRCKGILDDAYQTEHLCHGLRSAVGVAFLSWPTYLTLAGNNQWCLENQVEAWKRYQVGLGPRPAKCLPGTDKNVSCRMSLPNAGFLGHQATQRLHLPKKSSKQSKELWWTLKTTL